LRQERVPPVVEIVWQESGGPEVGTPEQRGFGTLVVERNLARSLDAEVDLTFGSEGVRCRMAIPVTQLSRATSPEA
jgi:two-component sensor histidine kinase